MRESVKVRNLDKSIRALHRGMTVKEVEAAPGTPRDHEIEVGGEEIESLWYRCWGLDFAGGRLDTRTRY
ncbi:MAG TPA: hypothetical protein VH476_04645 [Solirubrobacterales bacterium]